MTGFKRGSGQAGLQREEIAPLKVMSALTVERAENTLRYVRMMVFATFFPYHGQTGSDLSPILGLLPAC